MSNFLLSKRLCNYIVLSVVISSVSFISNYQRYVIQDVYLFYEGNFKAMICCEFVPKIQCLFASLAGLWASHGQGPNVYWYFSVSQERGQN